MSPDKLVYMANQIGKFFATQREGGVAGAADHLAKFWDPRMRAAIFEYLENGGAGLDLLARSAVELLRAQYADQSDAPAEASLSHPKEGSDGHRKIYSGSGVGILDRE
jgi:formate dehydrogenase subunit delta